MPYNFSCLQPILETTSTYRNCSAKRKIKKSEKGKKARKKKQELYFPLTEAN